MKDPNSILLPKWPFYLGDIFLVVTAFVILFKTGGNLSVGAIVWCIASIFLGAVFFVVPYYIEYRNRIKIAFVMTQMENSDHWVEQAKMVSKISSLQQMQENALKKLEREAIELDSRISLMESQLINEVLPNENIDEKQATVIPFNDEYTPDDEFEIEFEMAEEEDDTLELNDERKDEGKSSTVIARVQMGIGSKPYIRGEGGGLSWEKGIAMEFLSVGNWRWRSGNTIMPIHFKIFKNDLVSQESDLLRLEPGERLEIYPSFPN